MLRAPRSLQTPRTRNGRLSRLLRFSGTRASCSLSVREQGASRVFADSRARARAAAQASHYRAPLPPFPSS